VTDSDTVTGRSSSVDAAPGYSSDSSTVVPRCVRMIRELILAGELVPGQQLRQVELAERLKVSRIPLREALAMLRAEGAVDYRPNAGYSVARFEPFEMWQLYLMRELLETAVLRSIEAIPAETRVELERINAIHQEACQVQDVQQIVRSNHDFHFELFRLSPYKTIVSEIDRIWNKTELYATFHAYDPGHRRQVMKEHRRFVTLAKRNDLEGLIQLSTQHRMPVMAHLQGILEGKVAPFAQFL
jgi:DNA-binding GntR family transcriptional regulator